MDNSIQKQEEARQVDLPEMPWERAEEFVLSQAVIDEMTDQQVADLHAAWKLLEGFENV